jgi:hypothetical protein
MFSTFLTVYVQQAVQMAEMEPDFPASGHANS